ncbi:MAG: hypothetical protein JWM57_2858, partial [Phycisphaerales bacterium]|nr:hypothetical protein [Phycisphaerales bacterium]
AEPVAEVEAAAAEAELEPLDLEPLDLGDLSLELDADAPAAKAEASGDVDALTLDPEAPAIAAATEVSSEKQAIDIELGLSDSDEPDVSEVAAVVSDTVSTADALAADLSDTAKGLVELDAVEPDLAADADATTEDIETESAVPWATPAAIDKAAATVSETDLVDLSADLEADEREATEHAAAIAEAKTAEAKPIEEATPADVIGDLPKPALAEASAETVAVPTDAELADEPSVHDEPSLDDLVIGRLPGDGADDDIADSAVGLLPEARTDEALADEAPADEPPAMQGFGHPVADLADTAPVDSLAPAAYVELPEAPVEPDHIRLAEEAEEDAPDDGREDTALAVDLGLVLEDEHQDDHSGLHGLIEPAALAPVPADPVDIDLADARPVDRRPDDSLTGSLDLSHLGPTDDRPSFTPYSEAAGTSATDEHAAEDIFDVDDLELIEPETASPSFPAAEAATADENAAAIEAEAKKSEEPPTDEPSADDHIAPPSGGSLADLMPGGPPLLGGSFMSIPSVPRSTGPAGGPTGKRRPMRVGFGQDEPQPGRRAAPFAAERTIADAMGGVDADETMGDLMAAGPSIDAFSGVPATTPANGAANGVSHADEAEAVPADELLAPAERFRPRGVIRPVVPMPAGGLSTVAAPSNLNRTGTLSTVVSEPLVSAAPLFDLDPSRALRHKRRVRRVIACIVAMLVLIGGAAWAVYQFMPIKSTVDAMISFDGLDRLGTDEAVAFQNKQNDMLVSEPVRQRAIQNLPPSIREPGFLADKSRIYDFVDRDRKTRWPIEQPTVMRLRVRSAEKEADVARVRALGDAMIKTSGADREQIGLLKTKIQEKMGLIGQRQVQIGNLADDLQALQQATASRGSVKDRSALNAEYYAAEPALTAIKSKRQELEATIVRLKLPAAAATGAPTVDPVASDEELAKLSKQLSDLQQPMVRPESTSAGAEARKNLDASIAQFQQDLASAQKLRDNPELAAYVEAANGMFTQFRQLTEGFIRRQENNRTRLSELKATLSDKQQDRTQKLLETDTELKQLKDNLAILERQHNAAEAQGLAEEAKKSDLELRLLRVKIGEREDKFKNDTGFGEAITGIQSVIDQSEKESSIDRKSIDERLTALQADFMKNAPAVEKLPAEQKALAEGFEKKLAAMNDARRAYDAAADQAQQEAKANEAGAAEKVAALRLQIAARRQDVLTAVKARQAEDDEATRKTRLASAQTELENVRQQEQVATHRLADAAAAIEAAEKQRRIETSAEADRQAKASQRETAERDLRNVQGDVATLQASLARMIVPDPKLEMQVYDDVDRRPIIAGLAAGGIALLLLIPIIVDLLALAREQHPHQPTRTTDTGGFEPVLVETPEQKALPEPASV